MPRKFKTLGLTLVAVFAMSAMWAASSQAAQLTSSSAPVSISGTQVGEHELTFSIGTFTCEEVTFSGTMSTTSTESLTLTPTYEGCFVAGLLPVSFDRTGCDFAFRIFGLDVDIVCPEGKHIDITIPSISCRITLLPQTISKTQLANLGGGIVGILKTLTSLTYRYDALSAGGCAGHGGEERSDGTYEGNSTIEAEGAALAYDP
jgi:hypothetical protein